jgi:sigma-B regulation protein RsbU (phosphoserine phosphatase)
METPFETETIKLNRGDLVLFYTDGITEAWNEDEEEYGDDRLLKIVQHHRDQTAAQILTHIEQDVATHVDGAPQSDDITCVVVKCVQ